MNSTNYMLFEEERLHQFVANVGHHFTNDFKEAMFLWPDGSLTSTSEIGVSGDDYNIVQGYFNYLGRDEISDLSRQELFEVAASTVGTVFISPEEQKIMMTENQTLTRAQQEVIENSSYQIDYFSEGISQDQGLKKLGLDELTMSSTEYILFDEEKLQQFVYDTGHHFTDDADEAMFLWPNGRMTSSFEQGHRDDHNSISSYFEFLDIDEIYNLPRNEMLEVAVSTSGVIMMVPETNVALLAKNQTMTNEQEEVLKNSTHAIGYFSNGITQETALEKLNLDPSQQEYSKQHTGITR
ncbi:hypothetical protein D8X92_13730 [Listeria ivanovii]|uniref:Uncharacterized protein n=2 Tax=Listeria ivanovii TaxID=1638 RepID=A0ABS1G7V1_LISIV|nr:hypothetical protein [Listeria ivanovii]MBK1962948.1 hypothetical protein [Listeria ivanovii subsp. londoniensis]MBM5721750.1 hypothetical protein [Listeria ivanovii]UCK61731.1 hypothetical protein pLIS48_00276c [Listeria ivanovii]